VGLPDRDEDGDRAKRILSFQRRDQPFFLSGKPTSQVKIHILEIYEGFNDMAPLAEFIRNSWTVRYDERISIDLPSDKRSATS
jgi:hypothetical protein